MVQIVRILFSLGLGLATFIILVFIINPPGTDFKFTGLFIGNKTLNNTENLSESLEKITSTTSVVTTLDSSTTSVITTTSIISITSIITTTTIESITITTTFITASTTTIISTTTTQLTTTTVPTTTTTIMLPSANHVVFSEVFYYPSENDPDKKWIELYNPTLGSVDLSGLTIEDNEGTYTISNGIIIPSEEYLVIARNETAFYDLYEFLPNITGLTIDLTNTGDVLRLKKDNEEIDMVLWENFVSGWDLKADEDESIQRFPPDTDTNTSDDWMSNTYPDPLF